jgi:hypothetical protein
MGALRYPHIEGFARKEGPMILRQILHTEPVVAASYVFG